MKGPKISFRNSEEKFIEFFFTEAKRGVFRTHKNLFDNKRLYGEPKQLFSKGWIYAFMENETLSYFCAIAFDAREAYFFNEIRTQGKIYRPGFRLTKAKFKKEGLEIDEKDLKVRLHHKGKFPRSTLEVELKDPKKKGKVKIEWKMKNKKLKTGKNLRPWKGIAKFLKHIGEPESYVASTPSDIEVTFKKEGIISPSFFPKALLGTTQKSRTGYRENVYMHVPFYHCGWKWHYSGAFDERGESPDYFFGFMQVFHLPIPKSPEIPVHQHMYFIDAKSGKTTFFKIGEVFQKKLKNGKSIFDIYSEDAKLRVHIKEPKGVKKYNVKGIKFVPNIPPSADIEYISYMHEGELEYKGKTYKLRGTTELVGENIGYWL
jgi:hypothetical protein